VWGDLGRQPEGWLYPSAVEGSALKTGRASVRFSFGAQSSRMQEERASVYGDHSYTVIPHLECRTTQTPLFSDC
jgi:hypothetical protein